MIILLKTFDIAEYSAWEVGGPLGNWVIQWELEKDGNNLVD